MYQQKLFKQNILHKTSLKKLQKQISATTVLVQAFKMCQNSDANSFSHVENQLATERWLNKALHIFN